MDVHEILLVASAGVAAVLSGVLGMAGGLLLMGASVALLPATAAMTFHGATQLASNGSRAALLRGHVRWRIVAAHAGGSLVAFLALRSVSFSPDEAVLLLALGLVPFAARLAPKHPWLDASRSGSAAACGFVTCAVQVVAGVAGPLLDAFFVEAPLDRREIVATKAATQSLSHALKVAYFAPLAPSGSVSLALLAGAAAAALAGTAVGTRLLARVSEERFRRATRAVVLLIGAAYAAQGTWLLATR
jgi:uncharacterized membrane protein YfcA